MKKQAKELTYKAIARNLREFGYPDVTDAMIREIHEAKLRGDEKLPHGVIGMFADSQLDEAKEEGLLN